MGKPRDAAYLRWLQEHGVQLNGVTLDTFPGSLRGVVALRALSKGDVVVSVPDSLVLLADSGAAADALREAGLVGHVRGAARMSFFAHRTNQLTGGRLPLQAVAPRDKREALVVAVMVELATGRGSKWGPYLVRASCASPHRQLRSDPQACCSTHLRPPCQTRRSCTCRHAGRQPSVS